MTEPQVPRHLLSRVAAELESMRCLSANDGIEFPPACRAMLYSLPKNTVCMDCEVPGRHLWASISFGALLCLQCSGKHRGYGVKTSFVRSVDMDTWSHAQVLSMLEGGNSQLQQFFDRHRMGRKTEERYHTKAAQFYRIHLAKHVQEVAEDGIYEGREAARQRHCSRKLGEKTGQHISEGNNRSTLTGSASQYQQKAVVAQ